MELVVGSRQVVDTGRFPAGLQKVASGASAASGQTQISWTNFDQNHVYFGQALHGKCTKRYLTKTKIVHDRHKAAFLGYIRA